MMIEDHLAGAGFNIQHKNEGDGSNSPATPDNNDYKPPTDYDVHAGEKNTRQGVTLHPKDENPFPGA